MVMCPTRDMLVLGRSQSWTRALKTNFGIEKMDAGPLLTYFEKLYKWLVEENKKYNRTVGWKKTETEPGKYKTTKEHKHVFLFVFSFLFIYFIFSLFNFLL